MASTKIQELLADKAEYYLGHTSATIDKSSLHLPSGDAIDRVWSASNRNVQTLRSIAALQNHGRLAGTGYVSILPVDQGIEHSAGASFAPNPIYFDPENIVKLAMEGGCNAVASTYGVLGAVARKYAHKIPFIVKVNHNEFLSYPDSYDQIDLLNWHVVHEQTCKVARIERPDTMLCEDDIPYYKKCCCEETWWPKEPPVPVKI